MKPYKYRRWKLCYVTARAIGYGKITSATLALIAMSKIIITIKESS